MVRVFTRRWLVGGFRITAACIGALVAAPASAAETVELKFDWGRELTVLRDVEPVTEPAQVEVKPADPMGASAAGSSSTGAISALSPTPVPPVRPTAPAMRYRLSAKQQADGVYEIRVIDFVMRVPMGDVLISQEAPMRRIIDSVAPAVRLDGRGSFVGLLEPEVAMAMYKDLPKGFEERINAMPPDQQAEARAQFEEMRSAEYVAARAGSPWFESVGFWSGRRLEIGQVFTESAEERYLPQSGIRGPVRVERRWSAVGRVACDEPLAAEPAGATTGQSGGKARSADCVRLNLLSTFTPVTPPVAALADGKLAVRFESEIDLVTEPATLRPRRAQSNWRVRSRNASGVEDVRDLQKYRMQWTYGPPAMAALTGTLPTTPRVTTPFVEPANVKPKPVWAPGTPEQVFIDYRAVADRGDWATAVTFLHPELLSRAGKRLRSNDGVRASDEMRRALVGDEVTLEQVDASSDAALMLLALKRSNGDSQGSGPGRVVRFMGSKIVLGHVEDREGRIHLVIQEDEYRMPPEYRGDSSTVVMVRADQTFNSGVTAETPASTCEPQTDPMRCWRVWRHFSFEYEPISRAQSWLSSRRMVSGDQVGPSGPGVFRPSIAPPPAVGTPVPSPAAPTP